MDHTGWRCALAARDRDDDVVATAPPARRVLVIEVPGPWAPEAFTAAGLPPDQAARLRREADRHTTRVQLVRRPGRHPRSDRPRTWLLADVVTGGLVRGTWRSPDDLVALDLGAVVPASQGLPVVLVCTHGRHDRCCAIDGRPVAAALATDPRLEVWESSHLGGDRFAANVLALPSGDLAGRIAVADVPALADALVDGRVLTGRHRGRCGVPAARQAAHTLGLRDLGEDRPDRVVVEQLAARPGARDVWDVVLAHGARRRTYVLSAGSSDPTRLTCDGPPTARHRTWSLTRG